MIKDWDNYPSDLLESWTLCTIQDYNEDGKLSLDEFSDLIDAFGNQLAANKVCVSYLGGSTYSETTLESSFIIFSWLFQLSLV